MNILVTGSKGFVGKNLIENLKNIKDGRNKARAKLRIDSIYEYDLGVDRAVLEDGCRHADFVFNFAGVNRPKEPSEYMKGNLGFVNELLSCLKIHKNSCSVVFSSSIQAALEGRFCGSEYGKSKLAGEEMFFQYAQETKSRVLIYRFPNLFGKWCRPDYNSVVATFCNAVANDVSYTVNDESTKLELLYIDDLVEEMLDVLEHKEHRCDYEGVVPKPSDDGKYCYVPNTYKATLGEIINLLKQFGQMPSTYLIPDIPEKSFAKKLYSTYISYLPERKMSYGFRSNVDKRGKFTELIKTLSCGQISVNVTKPGIIRGQHWHNSKWEIFIVVSGHGLIQERKIGMDEERNPYPVHSFEVTGDEMRAVQMLPGYTHNIINLSSTEDLVTIMWANEPFDPEHPDTFSEAVEIE